MKKKTAWEKLLWRLKEAEDLAREICTDRACDDSCPLWVTRSDAPCAKSDIQHACDVLKGYDERQTVRTMYIHRKRTLGLK